MIVALLFWEIYMIFSVFVLALLPFTTAFVHVGISICHLLAAWEYYAKFKTTRK